MLAGAAGIMAQLAMQQTMDEITDYLAAIDEKVDDVLRAQKDAVVADMIGVDFVIEEAMTIREHVGRVSEVTWSKVQATSMSIARTQAYALRQLDALAEKLERKTKVGDLAKTTKDAEPAVKEWLAVLARCFQLQDAIAVLELDRVMDASPEELDRHRLALRTARQNRWDVISRSTEKLIARMDAAAGMANVKVLFHPTTSGAVVESSNEVTAMIVDFHGLLGIERDRESLTARRWADAASEVRRQGSRVRGTGSRLCKEPRRGIHFSGEVSVGQVVEWRCRSGPQAAQGPEGARARGRVRSFVVTPQGRQLKICARWLSEKAARANGGTAGLPGDRSWLGWTHWLTQSACRSVATRRRRRSPSVAPRAASPPHQRRRPPARCS